MSTPPKIDWKAAIAAGQKLRAGLYDDCPFPLCATRGVLMRFARMAGRPDRVSFSALLGSFSQQERAKWDRLSITIDADDYGIIPDQIEEFLSTLPPRDACDSAAIAAAQPTEASEMATATATRPAKKKAAKKTAKGAAGKSVGMTPKVKAARKAGKSADLAATPGDPTKNDPAQPPLPGMEEDRVPAIERAIKKVLDKRAESKAAKEAADAELARLPGLLHKHDLATYKCLGRVVVIEPGADVVKIKKVKDK
jgi:hypothetical protein